MTKEIDGSAKTRNGADNRISDRWVTDSLAMTLDYARERDYCGWDLYDGESSRILQVLPVENKWINLLFQQFPRRAPVNVRPLLAVEQRRSFMGIALFTVANLRMYELSGQDEFRDEARELADWLVENRISGYSGFCGGHRHPLQDRTKRLMEDDPDIVSTTYAVKALLAAGEYIDPGYRNVALTAADFVFEDLDYSSHPDGARIKYNPIDTGDHYTLNANALGARLLANLYDVFGEPRFLEGARNILDYVAAQQTEEGGWMYRDPPESSHLSLDNFHNGFVIESLLRYQETSETDRYAETLNDAVAFYRGLFTDDGAPWFDESNEYPRDVHSSAQGAVVFTMLGDRAFARRVIEWAVTNLSNRKGAFYHEKRRYYTKRTTLMRWCQAWMAQGISRYLMPALE